MCGICGIIHQDLEKRVELQTLEAMAAKIVHRGPDDEGYFVEKNIGLALKRLSIIDIAGGHQPIFNEDESIVSVYNGEIYNYLDIREKLKSKGHIFKTNSDTEVLVHLYEEYDCQMFEHLNGMFAFAIYDRKQKRMLLARDRLGIKPLYYVYTRDGFLFGSEIKSFLGFKEFRPDLDVEALHHYLTFRFVPAPLTLFKGVKKLPPGFFIEYLPGRQEPKAKAYWNLSFISGEQRLSLEEASTEVRHLIKDAVRIRLMSEVPLGAMLSGGVDSSAIVSSMKSASPSKVSSFTITYQEEGAHNEGVFAKAAAEAFQTDHHEITVHLDEFIANLEKMVYFMDEPIADPAAIPIYDLCRLSKEYVTVLLAGIGGDELFAGYRVYKEAVYASYLRYIPLFAWDNIIFPFYRLMPEGIAGRNFVHRIRKPAEDFFLGSSFVYGGFSEAEKSNLYTADFAEHQAPYNSPNIVRRTLSQIPNAGTLHKMMYLDTKHWLADSHLIMMDKMSMAHSIEVRVPFLDHRLVELAAKIPEKLKVDLFKSKIVLKNAFRFDIPASIINRPKRGFSTPLDIWFKKSGAGLTDFLINKDGWNHEYFNKDFIKELLESHERGKKDFSASLFTLLILKLWLKIFITK